MHYHLKCPVCSRVYDDDGFILQCSGEHAPSLLVSAYAARNLERDELAEGMYRFSCWLPANRVLSGAGMPATYQSPQLSQILGLSNLWITFSGYHPDKGASLESTTFKELEAYAVLSRSSQESSRILLLASAGNTAAAFARTCSDNGIRCVIVVPAAGMQRLRFAKRLNPCVKIICLTGVADYSDAIAFVDHLASNNGFYCEGGVKNIGRRDGIGIAMLSATETIGRLPDFYFQGIGSGAGAIAAHEAAKRLIGDGRFGDTLPRLMLVQNAPFTPIYDAWKNGRRELHDVDRDESRALIQQLIAPVLSNARPPYSVRGGLFDVLTESRGDVLSVTNTETRAAMQLFEDAEGIDIDAAAGVALAGLQKAAESQQIARDATVLLHITGGGWRKRAAERELIPALADMEIAPRDLPAETTFRKVCELAHRAEKCPPWSVHNSFSLKNRDRRSRSA
jgi:cysteate synthase